MTTISFIHSILIATVSSFRTILDTMNYYLSQGIKDKCLQLWKVLATRKKKHFKQMGNNIPIYGVPSKIAIVAGIAPLSRTIASTSFAVRKFCG